MPQVTPAVIRAVSSDSPSDISPSRGQIASSHNKEQMSAAELDSNMTAVNFFPLASNVFKHTTQSVHAAKGAITGMTDPYESCTVVALTADVVPQRAASSASFVEDAAVAQHAQVQALVVAAPNTAVGEHSKADATIATAVVSLHSSPQQSSPSLKGDLNDPARVSDGVHMMEQTSGKGNPDSNSRLQLIIERALHLVLPEVSNQPGIDPQHDVASSSGCNTACGSVRVAYRQAGRWATTPAVAVTSSGGAVWEHEDLLCVTAEQEWNNCIAEELQVWPLSADVQPCTA